MLILCPLFRLFVCTANKFGRSNRTNNTMMTSLETATNSFHLPQRHTQPLHHHNLRMLEDPTTTTTSSYSCAPPSPQIKSYFNPLTNETSYIKTEVKVHEIGILFHYEIRHASGVTWEEEVGGGEDSWANSIGAKAGDFFKNVFGGGDDDEGSDRNKNGKKNDHGDEHLMEVEKEMVSDIWKNVLEDDGMTWDWEEKCAGLVIEDEARQLRQLSNSTNLEVEEVILGEVEENILGEGEEEILSNSTNPEGEEVILEEGEEDILDTADTMVSTFSGTKLLGLTYQPLDRVNPDGCLIPDSTCTSISGAVSAAYSGMDEYGVIQTIIARLQSGMEAGTFIPSGSPALNLEFQSAGGTAPAGGNGQIIPMNTERGTDQPEEEEESNLSKYGTMFVCFVGILGAGFIAAVVVRYKKRQRRAKGMEEGVEISEEDYEANLAMQEEVMDKTEAEGYSSEPESFGIINQVELDVPAVDSNEVEMSLSGSKTF